MMDIYENDLEEETEVNCENMKKMRNELTLQFLKSSHERLWKMWKDDMK